MSVVVCVGIEFVPGDHGDSGDGLAWLGVMVLLDVVPFGLVLALCGLMLFVAGRQKTRGPTYVGQPGCCALSSGECPLHG